MQAWGGLETPAPGAAPQGAGGSGAAPIMVGAVNVPPAVRKSMTMVGGDRFVKVQSACDLSRLQVVMLPEKNLPPAERGRMILKAHASLVELDQRNAEFFGAFLKTLSAELAGVPPNP